MFLYAREESQEDSYVPSQLSGHSPWMVQESSGPVDGSVSQNCVCRSIPPGELTQQLSLALALRREELPWQLNGVSDGHEDKSAKAPVMNGMSPRASMEMLIEGIEGDMVQVSYGLTGN